MRHFAAYTFLKRHPGEYEITRRILGHKSIETTFQFYCGLEAEFAAEKFDQTVLQERRRSKLTPRPASGRNGRRAYGRGADMPRPVPAPERRCVKFEHWPEIDRALWTQNTASVSVFDDPGFGQNRNLRSIRKFREGYGRWLGYLTYKNLLDHAVPPAARVTLVAVRGYLALLQSIGNRDHTIIGRFDELEASLKILAPNDDFSWLTKPGGLPLRQRLPMRKRTFPIPHSRVLFQWGLELVAKSAALPPRRRQCQLRDGVLIAILAARAPRLRAITEMRIGRNLQREGDRYRLVLHSDNIKTHRAVNSLLPREVTAPLDRYLHVGRRELLGDHDHDHLWVGWDGLPLGEFGIEKRIRWLSTKRFGVAFGPYRFRHGIGTTAPQVDPSASGIAAAVLGITPGMVEEHYNRGTQWQAGELYQEACKTPETIWPGSPAGCSRSPSYDLDGVASSQPCRSARDNQFIAS